MADDPDRKIELEAFHCEILNDHGAIKFEQENYKEIPVIRKLDQAMVQRNYLQIKQDVDDIIQSDIDRVLSDSQLKH